MIRRAWEWVVSFYGLLRFLVESSGPTARLARGRLHVWRDASDWAVREAHRYYLLNQELGGLDDFVVAVFKAGHEEWELRVQQRFAELGARLVRAQEELNAVIKAQQPQQQEKEGGTTEN